MANLKFSLLLGVQLVAAVVLLVVMILWPGPWNTQRIAGSVILLVGMAFVVTARIELGQSFSVMPQARQLVSKGLYAKIRNPIYVFGTLAILGMCLILQRPILWLLLVLVAAMQVARARKEAQVLEAKFGDEYRAYRSKTWF